VQDPSDWFAVPTKVLQGLECLQAEAGRAPGIRPGYGRGKVALQFPGCMDNFMTEAGGFWKKYSRGEESTEVPGSLDWTMWHLSQFRSDGLEVSFSRERHSIEVTF
jgi:hypothetical protein